MAADSAGKFVSPLALGVIYGATFVLLFIIHLVAKRRSDEREELYDESYDDISHGRIQDESGLEQEGLLADTTGFEEEQSKSKLFTYSSIGGQMLKYDVDKSTSFGVLFHLDGTLLAHPQVTKKILINWVIAAVAFVLEQADMYHHPSLPLVSIQGLHSISSFFTSLIGILLGFYISTVVSRWWSLRTSTLGALWGAVGDLCLLLGADFPGKQWRPMRSLVLRYSLASYELTFMQAQGDDSELWRLVNRNLLTEDECAKLQDIPSRSQAIWTWVAWIFHELAAQGHMSDIVLKLYYEKCCQARGAIGGIFAYLNTQLPFAYVQLLASMVHVLCVVVAVDAGLSTSRFVTACLDPKDEPVEGPMQNVLCLTLVPLFYHSCLEIGRTMTNPLGKDFEDFPRHAYHFWMRNESQAFHSTFEEPTLAARHALKCGEQAQTPREVPYENGKPATVSGTLHSPGFAGLHSGYQG